MFTKLAEVEKKYEQLEQDLQRPGVADDQVLYRKMMKEMAALEEVVKEYRTYLSKQKQLVDSFELLSGEQEAGLKQLIKDEISTLEYDIASCEERLKVLLLPKDPNDDKNIILEIRAGAGGDEAGLFAKELFRAYSLYAASQNWRCDLMSISEGSVGGYKEVIASISGEKVFSKLKYESGVHRVQRVPQTEASGRVHTSTITVAVLPEAESVDVKINPNDLRIDTTRASGSGGQSVNRTDSAVRITHLPTGLVVYCQEGKSQHSNRERAMTILFSRLLAQEEERARKEASDARLSQIGTGDRSERIRTYNFPQSRITDHRIGFTSHSVKEVMDGNLTILIEPLMTHFRSEALKKQTES
ncbi:MAG: peptide chain release factor 1 [Bdellovibrionales bacterium]|nr:peptide chain release factor 1 [Bdellovibrionales bacterium]